MHTTKLTPQDFQTEVHTRNILAKVKKTWRVSKTNTNLPYADYTKDFIFRINKLMRAGRWDLAIDWIIDLNNDHVPGLLKFPQIADTTDQPFLWFLLYSTHLKDEEYWEGLYLAASLEEDYYAIPFSWWKRAFNNKTNAGKHKVIAEEEWLALLQSHPHYS